jgi:hypothetical protein
LPDTGRDTAAAVRSSCIFAGEPILGEVAYTVKMKVRMIENKTVVCVLLKECLEKHALSRFVISLLITE